MYPHPNLSQPCVEVTTFDDSLHKILDEMKDIMLKHNGLGLAANQCGLLDKMFVMKDKKGKIWDFINPEILFKDDIQLESEGCLSFPGITLEIPRAKQVSVKAKDRNGVEFHVSAYEIEAVCIQHEMEHLEGKTFVDNLSRQEKRRIKKELKK